MGCGSIKNRRHTQAFGEGANNKRSNKNKMTLEINPKEYYNSLVFWPFMRETPTSKSGMPIKR